MRRRLSCRPTVPRWACLLFFLLCGCGGSDPAGREAPPAAVPPSPPEPVPIYGYEVVRRYPHDRQAFTQGLLYHQGRLYESTGLYGSSSLREVELNSGRVLRREELPGKYFGEGLAIFGDRLAQLTWLSRKGFVYDLKSFRLLGEFAYPGEGWGLTFDGSSLILSNGTHLLRFLDTDRFATRKTLPVFDAGRAIEHLNELEYVQGQILANVWQTDRLVRIDPGDGKVTAWIDLSGLLPDDDGGPPVDVLNGIAYDEAGDRLFVTGKLWPWLFEIRLVERQPAR